MISSKGTSIVKVFCHAVAVVLIIIMYVIIPGRIAFGETIYESDSTPWDAEYSTMGGGWDENYMILDDPEYRGYAETDEISVHPVITSVGRSNVKVRGVKSKGTLLNYTIPEQLLKDDPVFFALMIEAEKYIGYPYVYGAANPDTGFDCSGFVCWVFSHSGIYRTERLGANGLYSLCREISRIDARPGDLVFFEKTMGSNVRGITHVGIYVGNSMMIHAGDPVGFADLKSEQWASKIYGFGRLPID